MTTNETTTGWATVESAQTRELIRVAARQMGDLVRTTLGPLGRDKLVVRGQAGGEVRGFVTNDGGAVLEEFEGETDHPIADRFIRLSEDHEAEYGDGVTTTVLLASELVATGMDLVDRGVHPNDVVEGFSIGAQRTLEVWDERSVPLTTADGRLDRDRLARIATTGMTNGRTGGWPLDGLADTVVEAVLRVSDPETGTVRLDLADTVAVPGGSVADSHLVDGAILPVDVVVAEHLLPTTGPVLLVRGDLTPRELAHDSAVHLEDRDAAGRARDALDESGDIAAAVAETGAVAVLATGDADWAVAEELAGHGAVLVRNVKDSHFEYVARATGATPRGPVTPGTAVDPDVLGHAAVEYRDAGRDDDWLAFRPADADGTVPAVTLVVRGGTRTAAEEAQRRVRDGANAVRAAVKNPAALPAGGAAELGAAADVRSFASRFDGREQLAVEAFADALETVPKTLAANAGIDPLAALGDLRSRHDAGRTRAAVSTHGEVVDDVTADGGGLDAFQVKVSGLVRAVEFTNALVRVDSLLVDTREPSVDRVLDEPEYGPGEVPDADREMLEETFG